MAIKQINTSRDFDQEEFVIDSAEDVENLPDDCGWGSTAICIASGEVYILNSDCEWVVLGSGI